MLLMMAAMIGVATRGAFATEPDAEQVKFFEKEVRPLLAENCFKCHGPQKQKGGLRLDSRAAALRGGESGPAIVPGKPEESLLVEAINYEGLEMPPGGKLADDRRAVLVRWVELGAPWPETGPENAAPAPAQAKGPKITAEDRAFWSFQPLRRPAVPEVAESDWARNPIDRFIAAKLTAEGLTPAPEADRRTLIRRAYFDLWGLPPTPEEVEAFARDEAPDAYERLIDRLLASPRYGERWGRHWLDLVRYAESDGYRQDAYRPDAWRYRDYVIHALNEDRPYDRFVTEQLAGDEIAPGDPEMRAATGFLRLWAYEFNQRDVPGQWSAILNDITDVTGDVFLGLGLGCARCHDHKFDPILQEDYYRLQAFFAPILPRDDLTLASAEEWQEYQEQLASWEAKTATIREQIAAIERPYREQAAGEAIAKFPESMQAILRKPPAERTPREQQLAELAYRQVTYEYERIAEKIKKGKGKEKAAWEALQQQLAAYDGSKPKPPPRVLTVTDVGPIAPPTVIPGDRAQRVIEPGFLTLLDPGPARIVPLPTAPNSTGRRAALARWLTRPDHPLTTRVIVNRLWQYHFGRGLVATPSDFGRLGERPSHPELLDWLASEFVARGWRLKPMHRLIMTSATYRQTALRPSPEVARQKDPENRWLWRMNPRRLEAEPIRDAMLAVSGELDPALGGPSVAASQPRRSIYTKVIRNTHDPLLDAFDAPDGSISTPQRNATTTPLQALLMINGPWTLDRARAFAARLRAEAPDDSGRIILAYRLAFGRPPEPTELAEAIAFLQGQARRIESGTEAEVAGEDGCEPPRPPTSSDEADLAALVDLCHALLNASEFLYID
ncbi:MAG: PSD1 domain-containing protein [Isosphaeraceae bacterium]|nr:PSD1 domain-containing protein [Isosphaeraceae bacterium]